MFFSTKGLTIPFLSAILDAVTINIEVFGSGSVRSGNSVQVRVFVLGAKEKDVAPRSQWSRAGELQLYL